MLSDTHDKMVHEGKVRVPLQGIHLVVVLGIDYWICVGTVGGGYVGTDKVILFFSLCRWYFFLFVHMNLSHERIHTYTHKTVTKVHSLHFLPHSTPKTFSMKCLVYTSLVITCHLLRKFSPAGNTTIIKKFNNPKNTYRYIFLRKGTPLLLYSRNLQFKILRFGVFPKEVVNVFLDAK